MRPLGVLVHIGANMLKNRSDIVFFHNALQKGARIGTVSTGAIICSSAGLRRVRYDRSIWTLHLRETTSKVGGPTTSDRTLEVFGERIIATGIEHQNS